MKKHPEKIKLKCQNPDCNREFDVKWKQRHRKYCNPHCQVPWHKNKTEVYSNETLEKMKNSAFERYKTKEGKSKKERLRKRNLSESNPWRAENKTGKEEWEIRRIESVRKAYENPEIRKKCGQKGEKNPRWKNGNTPLFNLIRSNKRLYYKWKFPILKRDKFTCTSCGNEKKLNIHHNKITLSEIVDRLTKNIMIKELSFDDKKKLVEKIVDYHIKKKIPGITLCKKCHIKIHRK